MQIYEKLKYLEKNLMQKMQVLCKSISCGCFFFCFFFNLQQANKSAFKAQVNDCVPFFSLLGACWVTEFDYK